MSTRTIDTTGRQQPLGDRSLNYSVTKRGNIDKDSGSGFRMPIVGRTEVLYKPQLQSSSIVSKNINYTPNHRRNSGGRGNAPFKSPITLCFDRMLGAGKCFIDYRHRDECHLNLTLMLN
jgi:hypothetical protein